MAWPFISDQKRGGELLTKLGMAILHPDVSNHDNSRAVFPEELGAAMETVAGWTGESPYRDAAVKWKAVVKDTRGAGGSSIVDFQGFLQHLNEF